MTHPALFCSPYICFVVCRDSAARGGGSTAACAAGSSVDRKRDTACLSSLSHIPPPCRDSASRGGGSTAACAAGSSIEASLLSEEEYLLLTGRLHCVLRPFMMRRLKEAVATELPAKVSRLQGLNGASHFSLHMQCQG